MHCEVWLMKFLVDEMPLSNYYCPFLKETIIEDAYGRQTNVYHDCSVTKDFCDLDCGKCSGLKCIE